MNQTTAYAHESQFGPPSELINISDFLHECEGIDSQVYLPYPQWSDASTSQTQLHNWTNSLSLSQEEKAAVEAECRSVSVFLNIL